MPQWCPARCGRSRSYPRCGCVIACARHFLASSPWPWRNHTRALSSATRWSCRSHRGASGHSLWSSDFTPAACRRRTGLFSRKFMFSLEVNSPPTPRWRVESKVAGRSRPAHCADEVGLVAPGCRQDTRGLLQAPRLRRGRRPRAARCRVFSSSGRDFARGSPTTTIVSVRDQLSPVPASSRCGRSLGVGFYPLPVNVIAYGCPAPYVRNALARPSRRLVFFCLIEASQLARTASIPPARSAAPDHFFEQPQRGFLVFLQRPTRLTSALVEAVMRRPRAELPRRCAAHAS